MQTSRRRTRDLGTVDGSTGDGYQRTEGKVDVRIAGPRSGPDDGGRFVDLELTARRPAGRDRTVRAELPAFLAAALRDELDGRLEG